LNDSQIFRGAQAGPNLSVFLAVVLIGICIVVYWRGEGSLWSVRFIDRLMIRVSVILFSVSFSASALASLIPNDVTHWILRNRRNFTISFVSAFVLHLFAIARFYALDAGLFWSVSPPRLFVLRCVGVVFIVLMLLEVLKRHGVERLRVLNALGPYYVWLAFFNGFAKRVLLNRFYLLPAAFLILVLAVKLASRMCSRKTDNFPVMNT
jgi:hypothetical protein